MNRWILIIVVVGVIVYFNSLFNGFVWDDEEQIVNNPVIRSVDNIGQAFGAGTFYSGGAGLAKGFYRPVVTIYYMLIYQVFKLNAWGYHLTQIAIHLMSAVLVYKLLARWIEEKWAGWGGLVFAVHSGISKTVVYAASVGDALYTLFILGSLWAWGRNWIVGISVWLALLAKESAVAAVPLVLIYGWWFGKKNQRWTGTAAVTIAVGAYVMLRLVAGISIPELDLAPITQATLAQRLMTVPSELGNYLRLVFWPARLTISQHWVVEKWQDPRFWGWGLVVTGLVASLLWLGLKLKSKIFWFGILWVGLSLGVVLNIYPLDGTIDETWLYFPLIGIIGFFLYSLPKSSKFCVYGLAVVVLSLGTRTMARNQDWKNGLILYGRAIKDSPPSYELENNYGVELFRTGKLDEAKGHFEKSIKLQPDWWFAYNNLGAIYQRGGDLQTAKSLYEQSLERADYYLAYENLAVVKLKLDKDEETEKFLIEALKKLPANEILNQALAIVKYRLNALRAR